MKRMERLAIAHAVKAHGSLPEPHISLLEEAKNDELFPMTYSHTELRRKWPRTMLVREVCKKLVSQGLPLKSNDLFRWFRAKGFLLSDKRAYNSPSVECTEKGWIVSTPSSMDANGVKYVTPHITPEGYHHFSSMLMKERREI